MLKRIFGCLEIALGLTFILCGFIEFAVKMLSGGEVSLTVVITIFMLLFVFLLACICVYSVNPTLWDTVHEKRDDQLLLRMMPDIYVIVEFVDYVSSPSKRN